jgi:hypothetical protein
MRLFATSTRRLVTASEPIRRGLFLHGRHASTYNTRDHQTFRTANPARNVSYSPISRNQVEKPLEKPQETREASQNAHAPPEVSVPPMGPSVGVSGGGPFTTGSSAVDTLLTTTIGLAMRE